MRMYPSPPPPPPPSSTLSMLTLLIRRRHLTVWIDRSSGNCRDAIANQGRPPASLETPTVEWQGKWSVDARWQMAFKYRQKLGKDVCNLSYWSSTGYSGMGIFRLSPEFRLFDGAQGHSRDSFKFGEVFMCICITESCWRHALQPRSCPPFYSDSVCPELARRRTVWK